MQKPLARVALTSRQDNPDPGVEWITCQKALQLRDVFLFFAPLSMSIRPEQMTVLRSFTERIVIHHFSR